jgi:hypothetical protein
VLVRKGEDGEVTRESLADRVAFVPLLGRFGWTDGALG